MFVAAISGMLIDEERRKEGMEGVSNQGGDAMTSALAAHHAMPHHGFITCYCCNQQATLPSFAESLHPFTIHPFVQTLSLMFPLPSLLVLQMM